jgi:hypothetical protein
MYSIQIRLRPKFCQHRITSGRPRKSKKKSGSHVPCAYHCRAISSPPRGVSGLDTPYGVSNSTYIKSKTNSPYDLASRMRWETSRPIQGRLLRIQHENDPPRQVDHFTLSTCSYAFTVFSACESDGRNRSRRIPDRV